MSSSKVFIGRSFEIQKINNQIKQSGPNLVVIKGRRRVGKSRLIQEVGKQYRYLSFAGLPPAPGVTDQTQRDNFGRQLAQLLNIAPITFTDWADAFYTLSQSLSEALLTERTLILFDEISWMASHDPTFIPKLKNWWELEMFKHPDVTLVFCGSVSTWIEESILNSTAFFGRINLTITLPPLSIFESAELLKKRHFKGSNYDIYKILAVTGGIPWYLEQIHPQSMADANIQRLCFEKEGLLTTEFDRIFHDLFNGSGAIYKKILQILSSGMKTQEEIRSELNYAQSGTLSNMLNHLITAGFITQHAQWSLKTGKTSKQSLYRLSDCYVRFYLKYIEPNRLKIDQNSFQDLNLEQLPGWLSMMGFQIENLLLENRPLLLKSIGILSADIVADNPYLQQPTLRKKGCQIDYLVQTRTQNLFICEFKFKRQELGTEIIEQMKEKIARLSMPRGMATVPILFHLGGISDAVHDQQYFYRIIDLNEFLSS